MKVAVKEKRIGVALSVFQQPAKGRPKSQRLDDAVKGKAARALDHLIAAGQDKLQAAYFVAQTFRDLRVRGSDRITPKTIINWRNRCNEGNGAVSSETLEHYLEALPGRAGSSPAELQDLLVKDLKLALIAREPHSQ